MPDHPPGATTGAVDDVDAFLDRWRQLHGGVDPRATPLVRRWLTVVHACARPLARRRVPPDALTLAGLLLALATVPVAVAGGRWALAVGALTAVSALLDSLDGAVAVLTGRVTRWGALLDAVCDRGGDVALAGSLAVLGHGSRDDGVSGAFALPLAVAVVLPLLLEYVRARATSLRMPGLELVTVGERPTRLVLVVMFSLATGVTEQRGWALAGLWLLAGSALVGVVTLLRRLRRLAR